MRLIQAFIILMFCAIQSFGQLDSLDVYFEIQPGPTASQVDLDVNVNNWESLVGVDIFVLFDSLVLDAVQVPFIESTLLNGPAVTLPFQISALPNGAVRYNFFDFSGPSLPDSTTLFTVRFDVIGNPCDESLITIGDIGTGASEMTTVTGVDGNNNLVTGVGATSNDITFMIPGLNCDAPDPVNFAFPQVIGITGDNVCVPLTVMEFDSIDAFSGSMIWDSQVLQFTGVQDFGVSSLSAADFDNLAPGILGYSWTNAATGNPETLASGATLFEVCFDVVGMAGASSALSISNTPTMIAVSKAGPTPTSPSVPLTFTITNGNLVVPAAPVPDPVGFNFGNISGSTGDNVCLPLTVTDFTNITSLGGSVNWDASVLQFTGVGNFGISSLMEGDFNPGTGNLTFLWMDPISAESLDNGTTLFEVCFDILGGQGTSSSVNLSNTPNPVFVNQAGPNPGDPSFPIGFNLGGGSISVPGVSAPDPVIFNFPNLNADNGTNVCVPLTVDNFISIVSANGSLAWDPTVVSYTGAQNFGLDGLASSISDMNAATGSFTFSWSDQTPATPETLANGTTLMELCFDVVGAGGTSTAISVTDTPTSITVGFQDPDPSVPVVDLETIENNGSLTVNGGGGGGLGGEGEAIVYTFNSISAANGSNVCIPLTVDFFIDIVSATGSLQWDPAILSFTGTQNFGVDGLSSSINTGPASSGNITFAWFDNTPLSAETIPQGGTFMEVCFDVVGCMGNSSTLEVTNFPTDISVGYGPDPALPTENIDAIVNGGVVVATGTCPGGGGPGAEGEGVVFTFPNVTANVGSNVCVPLTVDFFIDIVSATGSIMWDPAILSFTGTQNFGVDGLSSAINTGPSANGMISFGWFDNTPISAETIPPGGTFMELCFDVVGDGVSDLKLTDDPTEISVGYGPDPSLPTENIEAIPIDGSVTGIGITGEEVVFTFPDLCFNTGQLVCFPLEVANFTNISQVDFSLAWNPSVLDYSGVENAVLSGFNPLSSINAANIDEGFLTFSWFDGTAVNPNTFPDGTNIIEFCFEVIGQLGEVSDLNIIGTPTPIVVSQADPNPGVPGMEVPTIINNGSFAVKESALDFNVSLVCPPVMGDVACVDFVVTGFNDLVVTEWNWTWNPDELCFREIRNINPLATAVSEIDFGFFGGAIINRMNIAWTGTNTPTTIPDGETYFTICYDVKAACPTSVAIDILEPTNTTPFFVTNESDPDRPLPVTSNSCVLDIECPPVGTVPTIVGTPASVNASACGNPGSLSFNFTGGTGPFTCQATGFPAQACQSPALIENLPTGSYFITITDTAPGGVSNVEGPFTVGADAPIVITPGIVDVPCNATTGSITINATGGLPPYQFGGPNGPIQTHTGLAPGTYRIEVRDAAGCSESLFVEIEDICNAMPLRHDGITSENGGCGVGGKIILTQPTGGTPPYSTFFEPPITDLCNVPTGITYTIRTEDSAGMVVTNQVSVLEMTTAPLVPTVSGITAPIDCNPGTGGMALISITGGCEPVSCNIRQVINGQCTGIIPVACPGPVVLLPGEYKVTAIPAFGQEVIVNFTIPNPTPLMPLSVNCMPVEDAGPCFGDNGVGNIVASGGCGAISITLEDANGTITTPNLNVDGNFQIASGSYTVTATDANGVTAVCPLVISEAGQDPITLVPSTISADDCQVGIFPSGGLSPFNCVWTNAAGVVISTDCDFEIPQDSIDIDETLFVLVTDALGCQASTTQSVFCPMVMPMDSCSAGIAGEIMLEELAGGFSSCAGTTSPTGCDGTVSGVLMQDCHTFGGSPYTITAISSIAEQFSITLDEPGAWVITGLCEDAYSISVTDAQGNNTFPGVDDLVVNAPPVIDVTLEGTVCEDEDEENGALLVNIVGGAPNTGYRVNWTDVNGESLDCIFECTSLAEGTYFIEVMDDNDCVITDLFEVEPCPIDTVPPVNCIGDPVITPNGDGLNDLFAFDCAPNDNNNELMIYDRWGRLVHSAIDYQNDWGGTDLDGSELLEGGYHWVFINDNASGTRTITKGTVTLLRSRN